MVVQLTEKRSYYPNSMAPKPEVVAALARHPARSSGKVICSGGRMLAVPPHERGGRGSYLW
ncbi:hypothetical protein J6590_039119 [Homalodisca vitripennis]|nr:hypothetical protein J6590_039119 [Homalodisca vitripennis]